MINPEDAERVRAIFQLYLTLGAVSAVEQHLNAEGWKTRERVSRRGISSGGVPYSRGMLFHMLKNRIYRGEIVHGELAMPGLHSPIIVTDLFAAVQARLASQSAKRADRPLRSADLPLKGRLFDADGHPMSPSFGYGRGGRVYRYYVSAPLQTGRKHLVDRFQAIRRVTAEAIHEVVCRAVGPRLTHSNEEGIHGVVGALQRVEILADEVRIALVRDCLTPAGCKGLEPDQDGRSLLVVPVRCRLRGGRVEQVFPAGTQRQRIKRDPTLVRGLQQAHRLAKAMGWRAGDGSVDSVRMIQPQSAYERKLVRLVFIAPDLQRAILEGRQAPRLTLARLLHEPIPTDWIDQRRAFG